MPSTSRIVASIPGRIRLRDPALRQPERLSRLTEALRALAGVRSAAGNPAAGSIVVHYDATAATVDAMEAAIEEAAEREFTRPNSRYRPSTRVRVNRYAKRGMLVSLSVSLLLAALGQKRWHVLSGGVFVGCLGVHLLVHRRNLLR